MKRLNAIFFAAILLSVASSLEAQKISPSTPPPPPQPAAADPPAAPSEPVFDPLHAQRSLDVGTFYLKKGDVDAAINRFEEASHYQPGLAKPWEMLGEAYEKKHNYARAAESYRKYLSVFPGAEDAAKIRKRIALLEQKIGHEATSRSTH